MPPSEKDKNFVINTIGKIKYVFLRNNIAPHGANTSNSANKQLNDVIFTSHTRTSKTTDFSQLPRSIQSLSWLQNFNSQKRHINSNTRLVAITTLANSSKKDLKSLSRKDTWPRIEKEQSIWINKLRKNLKSVATQTDPTSNKGRGLHPLDLARHEALFTAYDATPYPLFHKNLNRVFNEEFIAQASKKNSVPLSNR